MHEHLLVSIDPARPQTAAVARAPDHVETRWLADIGDRVCCAAFASASLATIAWMLWTAYWLPALR